LSCYLMCCVVWRIWI